MSYKAGIVEAITELKDRNGSSSIAIKKHMQEKLPKDKKWMNATYLASLKKAVADGDLVQVKNSYKLSADFKKASVSVDHFIFKLYHFFHSITHTDMLCACSTCKVSRCSQAQEGTQKEGCSQEKGGT